MRRHLLTLIACAIVSAAAAQNYEALNSFMEKYSQTWPKAFGMNQEHVRQLGSKMPEYFLNKKYNSRKLRGRFVLLNFWATWCSGCRLLSVDLDSLMIKNNREEFADVQLIGVDAQENLAAKGFDPDEWWAEKGIGFPTVGGQGADDCCLSVKGGHPCMVLIDGNGIIRGRWDAWTPTAAEEARLAVWALHVVPRDGIKADSATVARYLSQGRSLEAAYLLSLMPEDVSAAALRFKALTAVSSSDAVAYFKKFERQCEQFRPQSEWAEWKMPRQYVAALEGISESVYQSDTDDPSILDCGARAVRLLMNTSREQKVHSRTVLGVLRYRYGQAIMKGGEQTLSSMLGFERSHSKDKERYKEVEEAMRKYGITVSAGEEGLRENAAARRMMEVDEETKLHTAGLNDTIDVVKDKDSKVRAQFIVPQKMRAGKQSAVVATIDIADGWHAYADTEATRKDGYIPTKVEFTLPKGFTLKGAQKTYPERIDVINSTYVVTQEFVCPKTLKAKDAGGYPVKMKLTYQICDDGHCLPPVEVEAEGVMR